MATNMRRHRRVPAENSPHSRFLGWWGASVVIVSVFGVGLWWQQQTDATVEEPLALAGEPETDVQPRPITLPPPPEHGYVGPQVCGECHSENHSGFVQTNHFRACREVREEDMPAGFTPETGRFDTAYPGLRFEMERQGEDFLLQTIQDSPSGEQRTTSRFDLVLGAGGTFDDVFLHWRDDGWMYELPVVWLYPSDQWAVSHFDPHSPGDHSRPLTARCLECHSTWVEHVTGTANRYRRRDKILGVTCESCHGPGGDHVGYHRSNPESVTAEFIVHPGELERERQIEVCSQCHSNAMKRRGPAFSYRPGKPLDESFRSVSTQHDEDDHVANQAKYMQQSVCFQEDASMTCVTCHNPHQPKTPANTGSTSCFKCHAAADCGDRPNLPTAIQDQCVDCHMPQFIKINVNFQTEDDNFVAPIRRWQHRIAVYPHAREEVLRDWHREQSDAESQAEAERLTKVLVEHYLEESESRRRNYRYVGAIAAIREALRIEDTPETREKLRQAVAVQTNLEALWADALMKIAQQRSQDAMLVLEEILRLKPDDAKAHGKLGTEHAKLGEQEKAEEYWQAVTEHDPDDAYGLAMLGWSALLQKNYEQSLAYYLKADEIEPYEAKIKYNLGMALAQLNRLSEASDRFQEALEIEPDHAGAINALIAALRRQTEPAAIAEAEGAAERTAYRNFGILLVLADIYAAAGRHEAAIRSATAARRFVEAERPEIAARIDQAIDGYRAAAAAQRE